MWLCYANCCNGRECQRFQCLRDHRWLCTSGLNYKVFFMLIRVIYISNAVATQTANTTQAILRKAQNTNLANGITGVLCQGQGVYLQALEGERSTVTQLYARIYADKRHANVEMIHCESIAKRRYENWSMAHVSLSDVDPETKIVWPEFDPYSLTGQLVMARIDDLLASGAIIEGST